MMRFESDGVFVLVFVICPQQLEGSLNMFNFHGYCTNLYLIIMHYVSVVIYDDFMCILHTTDSLGAF